MQQHVEICKITINKEADVSAFEHRMINEVFKTLDVGKQTRGGIVTAQYLVKEDSDVAEHHYSWIIYWTNQGGSLFGAVGTPKNPVDLLAEFGTETSFVKYVVLGQEEMEPRI